MTPKQHKTASDWIFAQLRDLQEEAEKPSSAMRSGFRVTTFYGNDGKLKLTHSPSQGQTFIGVPWSGTALRAAADMLAARAALGREGTRGNLDHYNKANARFLKVVAEDGPITERHRAPVLPKENPLPSEDFKALEADIRSMFNTFKVTMSDDELRKTIATAFKKGESAATRQIRTAKQMQVISLPNKSTWGVPPDSNLAKKIAWQTSFKKGFYSAAGIRENPTPKGPRGDVDEVGAQELHLTIVNERDLTNQRRSIEQNLDKKRAKGVYQKDLAVKLWRYWVDKGAKLYDKQYNVKFNVPTRNRTAELMEEEDAERFKSGGSLAKPRGASSRAGARKNPTPKTRRGNARRREENRKFRVLYPLDVHKNGQKWEREALGPEVLLPAKPTRESFARALRGAGVKMLVRRDLSNTKIEEGLDEAFTFSVDGMPVATVIPAEQMRPEHYQQYVRDGREGDSAAPFNQDSVLSQRVKRNPTPSTAIVVRKPEARENPLPYYSKKEASEILAVYKSFAYSLQGKVRFQEVYEIARDEERKHRKMGKSFAKATYRFPVDDAAAYFTAVSYFDALAKTKAAIRKDDPNKWGSGGLKSREVAFRDIRHELGSGSYSRDGERYDQIKATPQYKALARLVKKLGRVEQYGAIFPAK